MIRIGVVLIVMVLIINFIQNVDSVTDTILVQNCK
jgi:hypothetical protein